MECADLNKGLMSDDVTGRIILPIGKHNFATEQSPCPSFAMQASSAAVAWEAYLCQKFRVKAQVASRLNRELA